MEHYDPKIIIITCKIEKDRDLKVTSSSKSTIFFNLLNWGREQWEEVIIYYPWMK